MKMAAIAQPPAATLRTVLYVDDDPDICEIVQTTLCLMANLNVQTVNSGQAAIDAAFDRRPDLILMDVMMPGLDGPATLVQMRGHALLREIPVVFLTAKVLPSEVARYKGLGALGVLEKPFDPARLCHQLLDLWNGSDPSMAGRPESVEKTAIPAAVDSLTHDFLGRCEKDVGRLQELLRRAGDDQSSAVRDIEWIAHSLHGSAALFGFAAVSRQSGALERFAEAGGGQSSFEPTARAELLQQLRTAIQSLADEVASARHGAPIPTAICQDTGRPR